MNWGKSNRLVLDTVGLLRELSARLRRRKLGGNRKRKVQRSFVLRECRPSEKSTCSKIHGPTLLYEVARVSNASIFRSTRPAECNGRAQRPQPFFRILTPAADERGIPPDVYHPGQLFSPLRGPVCTPSSVAPRWPSASKKPRRFHVVQKKVKKPQGLRSERQDVRSAGTKGRTWNHRPWFTIGPRIIFDCHSLSMCLNPEEEN